MDDNNSSIFRALIGQLEEVLCILEDIVNKNLWTEIPMRNDCYRMHLKMRNVISTLVKKTTNGLCQWEDLAQTNNTIDNFTETPIFENHITSEEYIAESIKIHNAKPDTQVLLNCLLILQELLGDILDSSCQISNCRMKLTSGVYVHDLITVHQQYEAVWHFLNSAIRIDDLPQLEGKACFTEEHSNLLGKIRSTLKQLTKIKLEIEHYFKVNLIELHFEKSDNRQTILFHNYIPYGDCSYFPGVKADVYQMKLNEDSLVEGSSSKDETERSFGSSENTDLPLKLHTKSVDTQIINRSHFLASKQHDSNLENYKNSFLNQTLKHHTDIFNFQLSFFESNKDNIINQHNPNMVGTDLMEQQKMHTTDGVRYNDNYLVIQDSLKENEAERKQNYSKKENSLNDKFEENFTSDWVDENSHVIDERDIVLPKSYLDQDSINKQDLFISTPLAIAKREYSYSVNQQTNVNSNDRKDNTECAHLSIKEHLMNNTKNDPESQFFERLEKICPFYPSSNHYETAMFDAESLIEIFRANKVRINSASGSSKEENSSFRLWPVAANYIYVSNARRGNHLKNVSSDCSSYITDQQSENSLEPIYQNHHYYDSLEESNEVGENTNTFSSSYIDSLSAFKNDNHVIAGNKSANPILNRTYNAFSRVQNTNFKCFNGGVQELNNNFIQKTMAVQFAHFGDSFVVNNKHYRECFDKVQRKENVEIVNGSYTNNLNSFISIFTSNLGPGRQLNRRKLFRRAMNTLGGRPFTRENIINNIQTLRSNSGPYRLFDINGYPLTDTNGNVLKDPYGKCLVDLDLMGLPKADGKIFDAAGHSSKDINFDPTQKPKTSTIILKLTDNLKRPLHLFDKYGRPLTDSYGKLLVNIHGRPLLRFDNFGQPSTDYRGGPLFTENGLSWSPKNTQLQEEMSESDTITKQLQNNPYEDSLDSIKNLSLGKDSLDYKNQDCTKENNSGNKSDINAATSDIWSQLEMVLTNIPKKKRIQPTHSKASFIVNNFSVLQSPLERIYPDKLGYEESNKINVNETLSSKVSNICYTNELNSEKEKGNKTNSTAFGPKTHYVQNVMVENPDQVQFSCKINEVNRACSKSLQSKVSSDNQEQENDKAEINYSCGDARLLGGFGSSPRSDNMNMNDKKVLLNKNNNTPKNSHRHRNQQCLKNFSKEVFHTNSNSNQINSPLHLITTNGKSELTDFSHSQLTSAGNSKYTTDISTSSDSPMMIDSSTHSSNQFQNLQNHTHYCPREKGELDCQNIKQISINIHRDYPKNYEGPQNHLHVAKTDFDKNKIVVSPLKRVPTDPHVSKNHDRLCDIKLADIVLKSLDSDIIKHKVDHRNIQIKKEIIRSKRTTQCHENAEKMPTENYYIDKEGDQCKLRKGKIGLENINGLNEQRKETYDSLFRFNSREAMDVDNIEVKYIRGENGEVTSCTSVDVLVKTSTEDPQNLKNNLHRVQLTNKEQLQCKISTKDNGNSNLVSKVTHQSKQPADKMGNIKNKIYQKKYIHRTQKVTPDSKECNLVSLLGSPVRYVLNKLDLKKSSKQKSNRMNREPKKTNKHHHAFNRDDQYKTLKRDSIIYYKKENPNKLKQEICVDKELILAFRSKSCIEMRNKIATETMSYSGNEDNKNFTNKNPKKKDFRRTSSDITHFFEKCEEKEDMKNQEKNKKAAITYKLKHEPRLYAIKTIKQHKAKGQGHSNVSKKYRSKNKTFFGL